MESVNEKYLTLQAPFDTVANKPVAINDLNMLMMKSIGIEFVKNEAKKQILGFIIVNFVHQAVLQTSPVIYTQTVINSTVRF